MRPMMRLVLGLAALVGIMAGVAVGLPPHVTVTRSVITNAPESSVFPYLVNLHHVQEWAPWAARDPQLKLTYSGPDSGKGARVNWESQMRSIGTGSMEVTNADPNKTIELAVNFNGLEGTSLFDIAPSGSGSKITWSFGYDSGSSPLKRWKALALDGLVGAEYRAGLDKLKAKLDEERRPVTPPSSLVPGGVSTQSEQPSAALPPGAATPPGTPATTGTATPATTGPATGAAAGAAAPAAGSPQASAAGTAGQPANAEPDATTPAPAAAPPKKKKRRNR